MDREFAFYLIELLDEHLPLHGVWGTLNFDDGVPLGTYHINASLQLVIPLMITLADGETVRIAEAGIVELDDEEDAIEHVLRWCESWRRAMYAASPSECRALANREDISTLEPHAHPLRASLERLDEVLDTCEHAIATHFPVEAETLALRIVHPPRETTRHILPVRATHERDVSLSMTTHLIRYETSATPREPVDIKESFVYLRLADVLAHTHELDAFFAGWATSLRACFETQAALLVAQGMFVQDLFVPETLTMPECRDTRDFAEAMSAVITQRLSAPD